MAGCQTKTDESLIQPSPSTSRDLFDSVLFQLSLPPDLLLTDANDWNTMTNIEKSNCNDVENMDSALYKGTDVTNGKIVKEQTANSKNKVNTPVKKPLKRIKSKIAKGQRYAPTFKRKVLDFAVKHTFKETAIKYGVNCNTLTEWAREYKRLLILKKSTMTRSGSTLKTDLARSLVSTEETESLNQILNVNENSPGDVAFLEWLRKKRQGGYEVGREEVFTIAHICYSKARSASSWFEAWVERHANSKDNLKSVESLKSKAEKHIVYPTSFKMEVALYAKNSTKKKAAVTFGVSSRRVYDWCDRIESSDSSSWNSPSSAPAAHQIVGEQLRIWFQQSSDAGKRPKSIEIQEKARQLYAAQGLNHVKCSNGWLHKVKSRLDLNFSCFDEGELLMWVLSQLDYNVSLSLSDVMVRARELAAGRRVSHFKASKCWTLRFLKRHRHLLQGSSAVLNDLPKTAAAQSRSFCLSVKQRMSAAGLPAASFGCMDEIPVTFIPPTERVQTPTLLQKVGLENARAVVLLGATSDGRLLSPAVIFKAKSNDCSLKIDLAQSTTTLVIHSASVDSACLQLWARHVWFREVKPPSVLVMDSFAPHIEEQFTGELTDGCCHAAIIPPGCSLLLQPSSYNLARRFREIIQDEWEKNVEAFPISGWGSKSGPSDESILQWVAHAYQTLRQDAYSITTSFHLTGLVEKPNTVDISN